MNSRINIPSEVRRELRREAGFGCCKCGHPFYQYHHIIPYSEDPHMRCEDMMVLCASDHHLCTTGAIGQVEQRLLKANPYNRRNNLARGAIYTNEGKIVVKMGAAIAEETPNLIMVNNYPIVQIRRADFGRILVSAIIQDEQGDEIAKIVDNQWFTRPDLLWDFEVYPKKATVRLGSRKIAFEVDCRGDEILLRGKWFIGGVPIEFGANKIVWGDNNIIGGRPGYCRSFISLRI